MGDFLAEGGFILIFLLWAAYLSFATDTFLTASNLAILLRQAAIFGIVGIGATMVMLLGELDISFGAIMGLAGSVTATLLVDEAGLVTAISAGIAVGLFIGLINGLAVSLIKIPSVVATLGMLGIVEGIALLYTGGASIFGPGIAEIFPLAQAWWGPIPFPVALMFMLYAVAWLVTRQTRFGAHLYAVGDNDEAAFRAGISPRRIRLITFAIAGGLAGFGGVIQTSRLGLAQATMGAEALFPVLTAVILGGVSLSGGRGRIENTLIASVFLASIVNGLILLGVSSNVQRVVQGAVLMIAVSFDRLRS